MANLNILLGFVLILFLSGNAYATVSDEEIIAPTKSTIIAIQEADHSGADTSELISRFNDALTLAEQSETSDFRACSSGDECLASANNAFELITNEAIVLKEQANNTLIAQMLTAIIYIVASAFVGSFAAIYCYIQWKSHQLKKFLDMEIQAER